MRITIIGQPQEYKGFYILVQNIGNVFQAVLFNDQAKVFHQFYNEISNVGGKKHTTETMRKAYAWTMQQAIATCEMIINKDTPDKLLKEHEGAAEIVKIFDQAEKANEKTRRKAKRLAKQQTPPSNS